MTGDYPATASGSGGGTGEMTERAGHRAPGYVLIGLCAIAIAHRPMSTYPGALWPARSVISPVPPPDPLAVAG